MKALKIFWTAILLTLTCAHGKDGSPTVSVDKTQFVKYFLNNSNSRYDQICQRNRTKGIYNPVNPGSVDGSYKCCKGKYLLGPFAVLIDAKAGVLDMSKVHYPPFTQCDYNVTIENGNDDFATLMWKMYACKVKAILGKGGKDIDFKTYVEFRTLNYTMVNNVQKFIRDRIKDGKGCPEGDKETVFLKKLEKYFWCFHRNEQKICEFPSAEAQLTLNHYLNDTRISNKNTNATCPLVSAGTRLDDYCCNGSSTPSSHSTRFYSMVNIDSFGKRLPNGTLLRKTSYTDCIRTSRNLTANGEKESGTFYHACHAACTLNPVTFSADGSSKPEIRLESGTGVMDQYLSWFNSAGKNAVRKKLLKTGKEYKIRINEKEFRDKAIIFKDSGEAFKKLTTTKEKVFLYCAYYRALDNIIMSSSSALCHA